MKVSELIEELKKHPQDLEVRIHPDSELFIDGDLTAYGNVGDIEVDKLVFDEDTERYITQEDYEQEMADEYQFGKDMYDSETEEEFIESNLARADKIHAVFIKAIL